MSGEDLTKKVPKFHLHHFIEANGALSLDALDQLASELISQIRQPPYWLVLVTEQKPIDINLVVGMLEAMSQHGVTTPVEVPQISKTKIRVDSQQSSRTGKVTRYSRTPDALPLHTDGSNKSVPPNLVAFVMERPDPHGGGESVMLPVSALVQELPEDLVNLLHQPVFPFVGTRRYSILQGQGSELRIRYYRNQIDSAVSENSLLPNPLSDALDELDRFLEVSSKSVSFALQAGEVILMDNQRVLHGRGAMAVDSPRLMHRFRMSVPAMSSPIAEAFSEG